MATKANITSDGSADEASAHALPYRRCEASDLFAITNGESEAGKALVAASDEYLSAFVAPVKVDDKAACFHCGARLDSFMEAMGVGAAYRWGMAHGEATCSKCGWPARGIHRPKDADGKELWTASNLFLAYHPDFVEQGK